MKLTGKLILMTLTFVFTGTLLAQDKQTYPEGTGDVLVIIEGLKNDNGCSPSPRWHCITY